MRGWSHQPHLLASPAVIVEKSGGLTSISQHNPQQFQGWNWTESLVWLGHEGCETKDWGPPAPHWFVGEKEGSKCGSDGMAGTDEHGFGWTCRNPSILSLSSLFSQPSLCFALFVSFFSSLPWARLLPRFLPRHPTQTNYIAAPPLIAAGNRSLFLSRLVRRGEFGEDLWTVETEKERGRQGKGAAGRKGKDRQGKRREGHGYGGSVGPGARAAIAGECGDDASRCEYVLLCLLLPALARCLLWMWGLSVASSRVSICVCPIPSWFFMVPEV